MATATKLDDTKTVCATVNLNLIEKEPNLNEIEKTHCKYHAAHIYHTFTYLRNESMQHVALTYLILFWHFDSWWFCRFKIASVLYSTSRCIKFQIYRTGPKGKVTKLKFDWSWKLRRVIERLIHLMNQYVSHVVAPMHLLMLTSSLLARKVSIVTAWSNALIWCY